jgi:DNA repair photolyase
MIRATGTREWSDHSVNCCLGCRHGCLYCYARQAALRWGKIEAAADWTNERADADAATSRRKKYQGTVMFPTTHDITAGNGGACLSALVGLLQADNRVLVVSKAAGHVPPLLMAAHHFARGRGQIELRVSLTCLSYEMAVFWEPGAPPPAERIEAIKSARRMGMEVSISAEPLLEPDLADNLVLKVMAAGAEGEIWIGAANQFRARTAWCRGMHGLDAAISDIEAGQTPAKMRAVYEILNGNPQVRWKDSYQRVLGIDATGRPTHA